VTLADRVARVFAAEERWADSLGPHHLLEEDINPQAAFAFIPPELLVPDAGTIVRLFSGSGA